MPEKIQKWRNVKDCPNQLTDFMYGDRFTSKCASFPDLVSSPAGMDENTFQTFCVVERLSFKSMCYFIKTISDSCTDIT